MAKLSKKSPGIRTKGKKGANSEDVTESAAVVKTEGATEQTKVEAEEPKASEKAADVEGADKNVDGKKETTEEAKKDEAQGDKPSAEGAQEKKEKTPKRRRKKGKKQNATVDANQEQKAKPSTGGKPAEKEKKPKVLAGLIFMCNKDTKQDCFHHRVFGLPLTKKDVVERVTPGMKLFLFDIDLRLLYGVYKASSKGALNLVPKAFGKGFPAQVRFRIQKDSLPLSEDVFKPAIKENYFGRNKFNIELSAEQVKKLQQLFRPIASGSAQRLPRSASRFQRPAPRPGYRPDSTRDYPSRRDMPYYDERRHPVPEYVPPPGPPVSGYGVEPVLSDFEMRRFDYSRDPGYVPADPYLLTRALLPEVPADPAYGLVNPGYPDPIYGQRYSLYSDATLRQAGKRPLEDIYPEDRYALPVPKRAHMQDELIYRDLEYQRAAPYTDERVLPRYYAGGPY